MSKKVIVIIFTLLLNSVVFATKPHIQVPAGDEYWIVGSKKEIKWDAAGYSTTCKLILYHKSTKIGPIVTNYPVANESFLWTVGKTLSKTAMPGNDYLIVLTCEIDGQVFTHESDTFFIIPKLKPIKTLIVKSPNGGEEWAFDTYKNITWNTFGIKNKLRILLYKNNKKVGLIKKGILPNASCLWKVGTFEGGVAAVGSDYKIKIVEQGGALTDMSDKTFSINNSNYP
jgi:frataxin-like iron-binding protein CyaY